MNRLRKFRAQRHLDTENLLLFLAYVRTMFFKQTEYRKTFFPADFNTQLTERLGRRKVSFYSEAKERILKSRWTEEDVAYSEKWHRLTAVLRKPACCFVETLFVILTLCGFNRVDGLAGLTQKPRTVIRAIFFTGIPVFLTFRGIMFSQTVRLAN